MHDFLLINKKLLKMNQNYKKWLKIPKCRQTQKTNEKFVI